MTERRSSASIQQEINEKERRSAELEASIRLTEASLVELKKERDSLTGGAWRRPGDGIIARLRLHLEDAKRAEHDETALRIVWMNNNVPHGAEFVLDKITVKQISVRPAGYQRADKYHLDGTPYSSWQYRIDIRKTFGIDADEVPPNWKPTVNNY